MAGMPDASVDLIFTDPPYGHNNNNGDLIARWEAALGKAAVNESEWRPIANDGHEAKQHPTEKPVGLAKHFIRLHSRPGDVVLDPFMGSGTTGIACVDEGRDFIGIEIDPAYYAMAQKRIEAAEMQGALL